MAFLADVRVVELAKCIVFVVLGMCAGAGLHFSANQEGANPVLVTRGWRPKLGPAISTTTPSARVSLGSAEMAPGNLIEVASQAPPQVRASPPLAIEDLLQQAAVEQTIILTFASYAWRRMALNLRASLLRAGHANLCIAAADRRLFDLLKDGLPDGQPLCVFDAAALEGGESLTWQTGKDESFAFKGKEFNDLQVLKYQISIVALRLGLNVFIMDTDISVIRDFFPVFQNHYSHCPLTVYCCGNIGLMYFPAAHANQTADFLGRFLNTVYTKDGIVEGKWDQLEFPAMAQAEDLWCSADEHFRHPEQDGCFRLKGQLADIKQDSYVFHTTCVFGRSMHLKIRVFKALHIWFAEEEEYEKSEEKYLTYENPALYDLDMESGYALDEEYEAREFASALGIAIALNRTLVAPLLRCMGPGLDITHNYCPLVWPHLYPGEENIPYVKNYLDDYVNRGVDKEEWSTSELLAESLDMLEEKYGVRVQDSTFLSDPRVNVAKRAQPPYLLDIAPSERRAKPMSLSPVTIPKILDREVLVVNGTITVEILCGKSTIEALRSHEYWPLLRLTTALSKKFGGFEQGSEEDRRWLTVLQELHMEAYYRSCRHVDVVDQQLRA